MYKVTMQENTGRFGQHDSIVVVGVYATKAEADAAAADTGEKCRVSAYTLTAEEVARAAKLAAFGVAYKPAKIEDNSGWGKPAPVDVSAPIVAKEDRTAKLLAMNKAALAAEMGKRKPDAADVARLRANIAKLEAV